MTVVLDASVALSWLVPGEVSAKHHLRTLNCVVPEIFAGEVLNVLLRTERRQRGRSAVIEEQIRNLQRLQISTYGRTFELLFFHSLPLARHHRFSIFDAAYLEVAHRLGLPLATLDAGLTRAALAVSVPLA